MRAAETSAPIAEPAGERARSVQSVEANLVNRALTRERRTV